MSKVVQIAVSSESEDRRSELHALTDTGEIWSVGMVGAGVGEWIKLPPVPGTNLAAMEFHEIEAEAKKNEGSWEKDE